MPGIETFIVPDWSLNFLVNGDQQGLTSEEGFHLESFISTNGIEDFVAIVGEEPFTSRNDVTGEIALCYECKFLIYEEEDEDD